MPTIPGTEEAIADPAEVEREAKRIGFPLMIKASFGGGGRGMRVVQNADELQGKLAEALAPEHLEVLMTDAQAIGARLSRYGALFLGPRSAEVFGDLPAVIHGARRYDWRTLRDRSARLAAALPGGRAWAGPGGGPSSQSRTETRTTTGAVAESSGLRVVIIRRWLLAARAAPAITRAKVSFLVRCHQQAS